MIKKIEVIGILSLKGTYIFDKYEVRLRNLNDYLKDLGFEDFNEDKKLEIGLSKLFLEYYTSDEFAVFHAIVTEDILNQIIDPSNKNKSTFLLLKNHLDNKLKFVLTPNSKNILNCIENKFYNKT